MSQQYAKFSSSICILGGRCGFAEQKQPINFRCGSTCHVPEATTAVASVCVRCWHGSPCKFTCGTTKPPQGDMQEIQWRLTDGHKTIAPQVSKFLEKHALPFVTFTWSMCFVKRGSASQKLARLFSKALKGTINRPWKSEGGRLRCIVAQCSQYIMTVKTINSFPSKECASNQHQLCTHWQLHESFM